MVGSFFCELARVERESKRKHPGVRQTSLFEQRIVAVGAADHHFPLVRAGTHFLLRMFSTHSKVFAPRRIEDTAPCNLKPHIYNIKKIRALSRCEEGSTATQAQWWDLLCRGSAVCKNYKDSCAISTSQTKDPDDRLVKTVTSLVRRVGGRRRVRHYTMSGGRDARSRGRVAHDWGKRGPRWIGI